MPGHDIVNAQHDALIDALLSVRTREEGYKFLDDLLTRREFDDLSTRLEVARLLKKEVTYSDISKLTGASSATIGRVNRALVYGSDGYKLILERQEAEKKGNTDD